MKHNILHAFLAIGLLTALVTGGHAQTLDTIIVNVPFDFIVGNTTLPAGTYTVDRALSSNPNGLVLRGRDGNSTILTSGITGTSDGSPRLVFNRYGSQYFLHEIRTLAGVRELSRSRTEVKLAEMQKHETISASGSN